MPRICENVYWLVSCVGASGTESSCLELYWSFESVAVISNLLALHVGLRGLGCFRCHGMAPGGTGAPDDPLGNEQVGDPARPANDDIGRGEVGAHANRERRPDPQ